MIISWKKFEGQSIISLGRYLIEFDKPYKSHIENIGYRVTIIDTTCLLPDVATSSSQSGQSFWRKP